MGKLYGGGSFKWGKGNKVSPICGAVSLHTNKFINTYDTYYMHEYGVSNFHTLIKG